MTEEVVWPPTAESTGFDGYPNADEWIEVGNGGGWVSRPAVGKDQATGRDFRYSWWAHRNPAGRNELGRIVFDETHHKLESEDPLTISPSLLCVGCIHGFVRTGRWEPA